MLKPDDLAYFQRREQVERVAATSAADPLSREVHARLAGHYADRVWALEEQLQRRSARRGA